jgi:DNA-binding CsgD family transcriptional regulator
MPEDPPNVGDPLFGLAHLLLGVAGRRPILLTVDDLHWIDTASGQFVQYLARRIAGEPILLIAASRPTEPGAGLDLLPSQSRLLTTIRPAALSERGIANLVTATSGAQASAEEIGAIRRVTDGVPFLVEEVARAVAEYPPEERPTVIDRIAPESIGREVLGRVQRLPYGAVAMAEAVALFPAGATLADSAAVAGVGLGSASAYADLLVNASVLAPGERLMFAHPVMRAAVYDQLGSFRRRRGHARAAVVLRERSGDIEEIAAHLIAGEPSGDANAVEILVRCADRAEASGAPGAAARYLERALNEPPAADGVVQLRHRLGKFEALTGSLSAEATLERALAEATDPGQRVVIALDLAAVLSGTAQPDRAVETLLQVRSLADVVGRESTLMVTAMLAMVAWQSSDYGETYAGVVDALPDDLAGETPGERLALTQVAARMFDRCAPYQQTLATMRKAIGPDGAPPMVAGVDLGDPVSLLAACGAIDEAESLCLRRQDQARSTGRDSWYALAQVALAKIALIRGEIRDAEATARLGSELAGAQAADRASFAGVMASVCLLQGALDNAERWLAMNISGTRALLGRWQGQVDLARGKVDVAIAALERAWSALAQRGSINPAESMFLADLVDALWRSNRHDEAVDLAQGFLARSEEFGEARPLGVANMVLGRLQPGEAGIAYLERSVAILTPTSYRLDEARSRLELGAALRRANHRTSARSHLRRVLDYADRQGLVPMAGQAREELAASGARIHRTTLSGLDALTPSEARITRLAASGMTNREIAGHLFLTIKTVEMHLGNSFGKLGVGSRRELPTMLAGAGQESADA